jgi:hypothetical protein
MRNAGSVTLVATDRGLISIPFSNSWFSDKRTYRNRSETIPYHQVSSLEILSSGHFQIRLNRRKLRFASHFNDEADQFISTLQESWQSA